MNKLMRKSYFYFETVLHDNFILLICNYVKLLNKSIFYPVNIFISTEDSIAEKLLLFKINLLLFTTYCSSKLYFIENVLGKRFKFHSNLDFKNSFLNYSPSYNHQFLQIFVNFCKYLVSGSPIVISCIVNQSLWYNRWLMGD